MSIGTDIYTQTYAYIYINRQMMPASFLQRGRSIFSDDSLFLGYSKNNYICFR